MSEKDFRHHWLLAYIIVQSSKQFESQLHCMAELRNKTLGIKLCHFEVNFIKNQIIYE